MKSMSPLFFILTFLLLSPTLAFAYLDPGSGSLLLSSIIALFASSIFFIKSLFYKTLSFFNNGLSFQFSSHAKPLIGGGGGKSLCK